jgi:bacteriorhodopsin
VRVSDWAWAAAGLAGIFCGVLLMVAAVRERPPVTEVGMLGAAMTIGGLVAAGLLIWSLVDRRRYPADAEDVA